MERESIKNENEIQSTSDFLNFQIGSERVLLH